MLTLILFEGERITVDHASRGHRFIQFIFSLFLFQWSEERLDEGDVPASAHAQRTVLPHPIPPNHSDPGTDALLLRDL